MLKDYPVYFNERKIPTPEKWDEDYQVVENTNQTEAGTDQVVVIRYDKLMVSASFSCSSNWAAIFSGYRSRDSISVKMYDLKTQGYLIHKMRMRNFKSSLVESSQRVIGTNGLYAISFDLEEF